MSPPFLAELIDRLAQDPPRDWSAERRTALHNAVHKRYEGRPTGVPAEVESALLLVELVDPSRNPLVKMAQRAVSKSTSSIEACKDLLATAEPRDINAHQVASVMLFMAISMHAQHVADFVAALREDRIGQQLEWQSVVRAFDRPDMRIRKNHLLALYYALLPVAHASPTFDIQSLWGGEWFHRDSQMSFVQAFLSCSPDELDAATIPRLRRSWTLDLYEGASDDVKAYAKQMFRDPLLSLDATSVLFHLLFSSNRVYTRAKERGIPDLLINPKTDVFLVSATGVSKPWLSLQQQALKQLLAPFLFKKIPHHAFVLHGVWQQDRSWLIGQFDEAYSNDATAIMPILEHCTAHGWLDSVVRGNSGVSLELAAQAHAQGLFDIEPWLHQTLESIGPGFRRALANFLEAKASDEAASYRRASGGTLPLAVRTVHPMLWFLTECGVPENELVPLQRTCITTYPRLINYGEGMDDIIDENGRHGNRLPETAEKKMREKFAKMYSGESDVRAIISLLKTYKESHDPFEQDLFACMIQSVLEEYTCWSTYPLEALATTAVLFGGIINYNLLSRIALQVALAMVLEAVQEYQPEDSIYKFGLEALVNFSNRLPEWPNYCDQLLSIPSLQLTEIWPKAEEVVSGRAGELDGETRNGLEETNGTDVDELLPLEPARPKFSCLHADPPLRLGQSEDPDETVQDRVLFVLNNVSERNLQSKVQDLMETLEERHQKWFARYLVEERAKVQPNFQSLYLDLLALIDDPMLWDDVVRETYVSAIRMLNSDSILSSTTERAHLKNMGGWLGSLTLARDQPILFRNISFKDLLVEGHDMDRLLIVIPFTCKVIVQAARSLAFKPPNPWLMDIIRTLMELYHCAGLKLNQKFEIEVLCQGLQLDHNQIEPSDSIRARHPSDDNMLAEIAPETTEAFNDLSLVGLNRPRASNERLSPSAITSALPDFSSQLVYPPFGNNAVSQDTLRKLFLSAAQQAIRDIIVPVVERSVTIAAISSSLLVVKDFAMEPDEDRLREAAHSVVKALSSSLALVTCKEPLRASIMNNIRLLGRDLPEQALPDGHILMFANDNLDRVCNMLEQAAEMQSLPEIDMQLEESVQARRVYRSSHHNQPFKDGAVSSYALWISEPYRLSVGGLNREQLSIYEEFGRQTRALGPTVGSVPSDGARQMADMLQEPFPAVPSIATPAEAPAVPRQAQPQRPQAMPAAQPPPSQQLNGYVENAPDRIAELILDLLRVAREIPEDQMDEVRRASHMSQMNSQLNMMVEYSGVQKDQLTLSSAGRVTTMLFSEPRSRLEVEILCQLLATFSLASVTTSRQVVAWLATIEDDRIFNAVLMRALITVGLMDFPRMNALVAKAFQLRRVLAVQMLSGLVDDMLLSEQPSAFRADFAVATDALTEWTALEPDFEIGHEVLRKLQTPPADQALTPHVAGQPDQLEYMFDEWMHLQDAKAPRKAVAAYVLQLQQSQVLKTHTDLISFLRVCIDVSVASYERIEMMHYGAGIADNASLKVDALAKLLVSLAVHHGKTDHPITGSKPEYLDAMLAIVVLVLCDHQHVRRNRFNQKVFFRLLSSLLSELQHAFNEGAFAGSRAEIFIVVARAFFTLQPAYVPRFSPSWLALISHRIFVPAMLGDNRRHEAPKTDGRWEEYTKIMEALLVFTGRLVRPSEVSLPAHHFYRGVMRVLLVIHHDYPEFLAENHFRFCNSIPMHCTQLRNLVVSAYPSSFMEMPDPFSNGKKFDRGDDCRSAPTVRFDVEQLLSEAAVKGLLDNLLDVSTQPTMADVEAVCHATYYATAKPMGFEFIATEANVPLIHAIVLYIGSAALASQQSEEPTFDGEAPHARLLEQLARQMRSEARFHLISAVANQLRWPNMHTNYFGKALLHLYGPPNGDPEVLEIQETITRVLLERLIVHRPHPWGLIITLLELIKNPVYEFWSAPFIKKAPEVRTQCEHTARMLTE